jgi:hypothetical protein
LNKVIRSRLVTEKEMLHNVNTRSKNKKFTPVECHCAAMRPGESSKGKNKNKMRIKKNKSLFIILGVFMLGFFCLTSSSRAAANIWETLGDTGMNLRDSYANSSLAIHPETGEPYLAFWGTEDGSLGGSSAISVMKYNGSSWEYVGAVDFAHGGSDYGRVTLVFNPVSYEPYISFEDGNYAGKATVMKYNGNSWETVGQAGFTPAAGHDVISLAFHPATNEPYVMYRDGSQGYKGYIKKFNGSSWENVGGAVSTYQILGPMLTFNPVTNEPYATFVDNPMVWKISVSKFNGSSWEYVGNYRFGENSAVASRLLFRPDTNQPYVVYVNDNVSSDIWTVRAKKLNGSQWEDALASNITVTSNPGLSAQFHPVSKELYAVYRDSDQSEKATLSRYSGESWISVGSRGFTGGNSFDLGLLLNPLTLEPYVSYYNDDNGNKLGLMKYDRGVDTDTPLLNYNRKKSAKKKINLTFDDLTGRYKKSWIKVKIGGKKAKVTRVRNSGNNLRVSVSYAYGKKSRNYYGLSMAYKKKNGRNWQRGSFATDGILRIK